MEVFQNPHRGTRLASIPTHIPDPSVNAEAVASLLEHCPVFSTTPLMSNCAVATKTGISELLVKDERGRMGLGSFKALGAAYVIAHEAVATGAGDLKTALSGVTYVSSSAGNHGLSIAAGAPLFGAQAVIYIAEAVPENFAVRLRELGARVVRGGEDYTASLDAALSAAEENGWEVLSDTSWNEYYERPHLLMEGYLQSAAEVVDELETPPDHIFLQAGVGGFAGAMAAYFREKWGDGPSIIVVEPDAAPALIESVKAGCSIVTTGPSSEMGRLDCKEPSLIALAGLSRDADYFLTISEEEGSTHLPFLAQNDMATTGSGGAGLSALLALGDFYETLGLNAESRVLCFITEEE